MSLSNGSKPLSFDLTDGERITFGFKQSFGKGIIIGGTQQISPSELDRSLVEPLESTTPTSPLCKTRSFSDAFAPELLPPLPSKPASARSNSEPFPLFPQHLDQSFQDSDEDEFDRPEMELEEENDKEEEINILRQYTNLLSPSPDRKKQRLHHIASSPPRFNASPFLTQSNSTSRSFGNNSSFGPFATGSRDFVSTTTVPLAPTQESEGGVPMLGADRMRSLSIGTGLDLLSLGSRGGGGTPMALPAPPHISSTEESDNPTSEHEEEDEEEAIPIDLITVSPPRGGGVESDLSLLPSPTESNGSSSSIEVPLAELVKEAPQEEEEDDSTLSELSSSPSPSLSPPPKHRQYSLTPEEDQEEREEEAEVEGSDQDSLVREKKTREEERSQTILRDLTNLLKVTSNLPQGSLEVLEACITSIVSSGSRGSMVNSLLLKLDLTNHSPSPFHSSTQSSPSSSFLPPLRTQTLRPRFLPPKPRSNLPPTSPPPPTRRVPLKTHPAYPVPFELRWVYETGLDTFEEKREKRTISKRGVKEEIESEDRGFESDDECDERKVGGRGRGKGRGKGLKRASQARGRGRGRKSRGWEVDSE